MSQAKVPKISLTTSQYEAFKMEEGEMRNTIYNMFNDITVGLQNLGKNLEPDESNRKLLLTTLPME